MLRKRHKMAAQINIHPNGSSRTLRLSANTHNLECAPLIIEARDESGYVGEVSFHTYNAALTAALMEAINNVAVGGTD
jgi:hypothetical protein